MDERNPVPAPVKNERDYLRFLVHTGEILASSLDSRETMINVCAAAVETVADLCYLIMADDGGELQIHASAARDASRLPDTAVAGKYLRSAPGYPPSIVHEVVREGNVVFIPDVTEGYIAEHATSAEHAEFLRRMEYASIILVPIRAPGTGVLGALALIRTRDSGERFDSDTLLFAQDLGRRCGSAIARSQTFEASQHVASTFQRAALPRSLPSLPGITLDAYYEPAEASLLVGGDWYDAFLLPDGRLGMTMGDVTGHGIEAAAFMGNVRNALRTALCAGLEFGDALAVVDFLVREEFPDGGYATANLATLDPQSGLMRLISAGHPGPLIHTRDGDVGDPFTERGLPLGLRHFESKAQRVQDRRLQCGSFLAFFTDGLIEWERNELTGYAQLEAAMRERNVREAEHPAYALRRAVIRGAHADDVAIMCVRYERP